MPEELRVLIRRIARENPPWNEACIANELLLKLDGRSRHGRYANICSRAQTSGGIKASRRNAGARLGIIMPGRLSRVASV